MSSEPAGDAERFLEWLRDADAEPTPEHACEADWLQLTRDAIAYAERSHAASARTAGDVQDPIACRAGCSWCCHLPVMTSPPEVRLAWAHARRTLPPGTLEAIAREARELDVSVPRPCPFLVDDRCSVYAARPLACRGWNSTDADACRRAYALGYESVEIPVQAQLRASFAGAGDAIARGIAERGGDGVVILRTELAELLDDA